MEVYATEIIDEIVRVYIVFIFYGQIILYKYNYITLNFNLLLLFLLKTTTEF